MASFRKRQNKWQARIQRKGQPTITKSFNQFSVASQWARKIELTSENKGFLRI